MFSNRCIFAQALQQSSAGPSGTCVYMHEDVFVCVCVCVCVCMCVRARVRTCFPHVWGTPFSRIRVQTAKIIHFSFVAVILIVNVTCNLVQIG